MTISLNDTVAEIRTHFNDVHWSNHTLESWVKEAVREYSLHFPLISTVNDTTVVGTYQYDFFAGTHDGEDLPVILDVIQFEFPTGEDPPEYPQRRSHTQPGFFDGGDDYYDVIIYPNRTNGEIWISDPDGNDFEATFQTEHIWTSVDSGTDENTEVAAFHRPMIVQYVVWLCWREMLSKAIAVQAESRELTAIENQVKVARAIYESMLKNVFGSVSFHSDHVKWEMDKYDRIY